MHKSVREGICAKLAGKRSYHIGIVSYLENLQPHCLLRTDEILNHAVRADKGELFERYVSLCELGQDRDSVIIERATAYVRHLAKKMTLNGL